MRPDSSPIRPCRSVPAPPTGRYSGATESPNASRHAAQGLLEVAPLVVDLRNDHGAGHPDRGALIPQHPGQAVHALGGGDGEERRVRRAQPGPQVAGEVGVPGGIQQVHLDPGMDERGHGEVDRALLPDLHLVEVADGRAILHPAHPLDGAGRAQQRLDQSCLARTGMADQRDVAHACLAGRPVLHRPWLSILSCLSSSPPAGLFGCVAAAAAGRRVLRSTALRSAFTPGHRTTSPRPESPGLSPRQ